ncbi:MAG TPA: glycoside hydrolase family 3 protein [Vicinamibacteria bacterium]
MRHPPLGLLRAALAVGLVALGLPSHTLGSDRAASGPFPPIRLDRGAEKWADKTLRKLSLEEKVGQVFMIWVRARFLNASDPGYLELRDSLRRYGVGGFAMSVPVEGPVLVKSRPEEAALLLNRLQGDSRLPLLVAADLESGLSVRLTGGTPFPQAMALGASGRRDLAREYGRITALEARAVGVHWNFFPVADVNSNPQNPVINTRSFGEDPALVGDLVAAYIEGARAGGLLTTAKHFPGHGDTGTDSHYGVARVEGDRARLDTVELVPFRRAIQAGVDSVMVAHVTAPALDAAPDRVATTSHAIVTDLLQGQLGFRGLVVTDALDMAALTQIYSASVGRAAVEAFKAGNDMLLIPPDLAAAYDSLLAAVRQGEIPVSRLDASVRKILRLKAGLGLPKQRLIDVAAVAQQVGRPESALVGQAIADAAVTLVRDNGQVLPLRPEAPRAAGLPYTGQVAITPDLTVLVLASDLRGEWGRVLEAEIRARVPGATLLSVDPRSASGSAPEVLAAVQAAKVVVAAVYVSPAPGQSTGRAEPLRALLEKVLEQGAAKTVVVAVGSPYVASAFPATENYLCTFSNAAVSERSAVKALFGETDIRGRTPVALPGVTPLGGGIDRPAVSR